MIVRVLRPISFSLIKSFSRRFSTHFEPQNVVNVCVYGPTGAGKTWLVSSMSKFFSESNENTFASYNQLDGSPREIEQGKTFHVSKMIVRSNKRPYVITDTPIECFKHFTIKELLLSDISLLVLPPFHTQSELNFWLHLYKLTSKGSRKLIVFLNKQGKDTDKKSLDLNLKKAGLNETSIVGNIGPFTDSLSPESQETVEKIFTSLDASPMINRDLKSPPLFIINIVNNLKSPSSTHVTVKGFIKHGIFRVNQNVVITASDLELVAKIITINDFQNKSKETAFAGQNVGMCLEMKSGITEIKVGMIICPPESYPCSDQMKCQLDIFDSIKLRKIIDTGSLFTIQTEWRSGAALILFKPGDLLKESKKLVCIMHLIESIPFYEETFFTIIDSDNAIIAGGKFISPLTTLLPAEKMKLMTMDF